MSEKTSDILDTESDESVVREFGGRFGALGIMLASHIVLYYLWICWRYLGGSLAHPNGFSDIGPFFVRMGQYVADGAAPTWNAVGIYFGFLLVQALLAVILPGVEMKGLPIPSRGNT